MPKRSHEPRKGESRQLGVVAEIGRTLRERPLGRKTLRGVLAMVRRITPVESSTLYLLDRKKDHLNPVVSRGGTANAVDFLRFQQGFGLVGWVAREHQPILIRGRDPQLDGVREHHDSILVLPLLAYDELVGVLCFTHHDPDGFDDDRHHLLELVADQVTRSIERVMYRREVDLRLRLLSRMHRQDDAAAEPAARPSLVKAAALAAEVNREIDHPVAVIIGQAQMIELEGAGMPAAVSACLRSIVAEARRISLITHKLSQISRLVTDEDPDGADNTRQISHKSMGES